MVFMREIKQNARKDPSESGNSEEENNLYNPDTKILLVCNFIVSYLCTLNTLMLSKFSGKIFRHLKVRFSIYMYHFSKK